MAHQRVEFESGGEKLVGILHFPLGVDPRGLPAIVVTGSWTSVKEQMSERYAKLLAARGFVALTFDCRHWGESGGVPRFYECPTDKIADIQAAVAFLQRQPGVDQERIGGLAICASAGYMAHAIAQGAALKSFATVAAWLHNPETVGVFYGGKEGVDRRVAIGQAAREKWVENREIDYVPAQSATDENAAMAFPIDYYMNENRGKIAAWTNQFATMGWVDWLTFDALSSAKDIHVPTMMVHSDNSALPDNVRKFFGDLAGPKTLVWTEGEHTEFYDDERHVSEALDAVVGHFEKTFGTGEESVRRTVDAVGTSIDARDWDAVANLLAETVYVDYTSLMGGEPAEVKATDLMGGWQQILSRFDHTKHLVSNHQIKVEGDSADCWSEVIATHARDKPGLDRWTCGGRYFHQLKRNGAGWKVSGITLLLEWQQGQGPQA